MDLSVIIVNYNVKYYLEQCLESVRRASKGLQVEVFVVDNLSTDGSVSYLEGRFPEVRFIANQENVGFARANNQAIRLSTGRYVLLLNPDTIVIEDTFTDFVAFMDAHPEAGGAGAYMLRYNGSFAPESRRALPTPFVSFCKMSGLAALFPKSRVFGRYYMRYLDENFVEHDEEFTGKPARVIQHEYDHIEGVVFTDHLAPIRKNLIKNKLQKMARGSYRAAYKTKR